MSQASRAFLSVCLVLLFSIFTPTLPAFAGCTCYDDNGNPQSFEITNACEDACLANVDTGGEDVGEGQCSCDGSSVSIDCSTYCEEEEGLSGTAPGTGTTDTSVATVTPTLSVDIPTVKFTDIVAANGSIHVNFLGDYISGVYQYLIGFSISIAIIMVMIGGLQYTFAAGGGEMGKAKKRIKDAVVGLILMLSVYLILYTVNPNLTVFEPLELDYVQRVFVSTENTGADVGSLDLPPPPSSGTNGVPYFSQRDYTEPYDQGSEGETCSGNPTIKTSGCGPTSMAMVLNYHGAGTNPVEVAEMFEEAGKRICGKGTAYAAFTDEDILDQYGLQAVDLNKDIDLIRGALEQDLPVIISVGPSRFTSSGHFIVLTGINEEGNFSINDPNSGYQDATSDEIKEIMKFSVLITKKTVTSTQNPEVYRPKY